MGHKTKELPEKFESQSSGRVEMWSTVDSSARHTAHTGLQSNTKASLFYFFISAFILFFFPPWRMNRSLVTKQICLLSVVTELIVLMMVSGGTIDHC